MRNATEREVVGHARTRQASLATMSPIGEGLLIFFLSTASGALQIPMSVVLVFIYTHCVVQTQLGH